ASPRSHSSRECSSVGEPCSSSATTRTSSSRAASNDSDSTGESLDAVTPPSYRRVLSAHSRGGAVRRPPPAAERSAVPPRRRSGLPSPRRELLCALRIALAAAVSTCKAILTDGRRARRGAAGGGRRG